MANLDTTQSVLITAEALLRETYMEDVPETAFRFGRITERLFKPAEGMIGGDGKTMQVIKGRTDSARASRNPTKDFGHQRPLSAANIKLRFHESDGTQNDFTELQGVAEVPHLDLIRGNPEEVAVDLAAKVRMQLDENARDSWPVLYHAAASGQVALINGTPVDDGSVPYYDSTDTYTAGSTVARFKIDTGSIAAFEPGTHWDAYSSAGVLLADEMEVTHKNPSDLSVAVSLTTTGPNQSTVANLDNLADNAILVRSGEYNQGMRTGITNWFTAPSASETFVGGVDRSTTGYRWLLPVSTREAETSNATIKQSHFDDLGLAMSYVIEESGLTPVLLAHTSVIQTLRTSIGEDALSNQDASHNGEYTFGEMGLTYQHPQFGRVTLLGDPLAPLNDIKFIVPQDWNKYYFGFRGFQMFPGETGIWFRKDGATAGGGKSKFFRCEGYELCALFCSKPRRQGIIRNIQA